jgi:hypothetical protein
MIMHRTTFFLALFGLLLIPLLVPRMLWLLHAEKTMGIMAFETRGTAGDQLPLTYSLIYFSHGKDTIWFNGAPGLGLKTGQFVPVRYQPGNPADAKIDLFIALWGDILVFGGVPFVMLLAIFLHPDVIPRRSRVRLTWKRPFIFILAQ